MCTFVYDLLHMMHTISQVHSDSNNTAALAWTIIQLTFVNEWLQVYAALWAKYAVL